MKKVNPYLVVMILYVILAIILYFYANDFANSNLFIASITFIAGSLAFFIYTKQKTDAKRDAARIIIQEIRRAEEIINDYKQMGGYKFSRRIIATNSWSKNIHYFVGDLDNDELDKISDLYSTGEYLDSLIHDISSITFNSELQMAEHKARKAVAAPASPGQGSQMAEFVIPLLEPPWKARLDLISKDLEPIYHSTIVFKLKEIAQLKQ